MQHKNKSKSIFTRNYIIAILALFCCFLWGSAFPSIKTGYQLFSIGTGDTFDKILFAGTRFFIASLMIFAFSFVTKNSLKLKKSDLKKLAILGMMQTAIQYMFFYVGLSNTTGTKGSILTATSTFFTVILAHFFFKEDKLTYKKTLGIILGFIGVTIVNLGGNGLQVAFTFTGDGFIIIASIMGALAGIYTKKISKDMSAFVISGYQLFIGSIFLIFTGFAGGGQLQGGILGYGVLLYLAFASAAAFTIWTTLLKYNGVGRISIYKASIPIFGVLLSYIFLEERLLTKNILLSVILVAFSIILINIRKNEFI